MVLVAVYLSVMCMSAPTFAFPVSPDFKFGNPQKFFEIVDGPREFMMPLVPLGDILLPERDGPPVNALSSAPRQTDLNYMVYGKLYLMKAMKDSSTARHESIPHLLNSEEHSLTDRSDLKLSRPDPNDGISFPDTTRRATRPYRYKSWSKLQKLRSEDLISEHHNRRLEERSADLISLEKPTNPPLLMSTSTSGTITENGTNESSNLDEEALELIQKLMSQSPQINASQSSNISSLEETNTDLNSTTDNIEFNDRFLIKVPSKPSATRCPEGQKRTHLGGCKPVLVQQQPTPNNAGFLGPVVVASNSALRKERNNSPLANRRLDNIPKFELTTLFRSVVQLEKVLEKTIKDAEKQLNTMIKDVENSTTVSVDDSISRQL